METTAWLDNARFGIGKKLKTPLNFFFQNALQNVAVISQHSCSLQRTGTTLTFEKKKVNFNCKKEYETVLKN